MNKKVITGLLTIIMLVALTPIIANAKVNKFIPEGRIKYDLNNDKHIDAVDASMALKEYVKASVGETTLSKTDVIIADTNGDSKIDSTDASNILAIYAQNSSEGEEYPISTVQFFAEVKYGHKVKSMGAFFSYEEAMENMTNAKDGLIKEGYDWDKCSVYSTTIEMTDLPSTKRQILYSEENK